MRIYDISLTISPELPVYPGDAGVSISVLKSLDQGDLYRLSALTLGSHTGTHVDPPAHFISQGITIDQVPLETLVGKAIVVNMGEADAITREHLEALGLSPDVRRVLFKTRNGRLYEKKEFDPNFVFIREDAARWMVERGVKLVGVDYLSAEEYGAKEPRTHWALLGAGAVIVEGLDLREVPPGEYTMVCLPLKIKGGDGAPARAILITPEL